MGGRRHATAALTPENGSDTHCIGEGVGTRAGIDWCRKSRHFWDSIPGPSSYTECYQLYVT